MKTVLITSIGSYAAEAAIKKLKQEGYRVLGCDIYPREWVVNADEPDVFYQAPYATERDAYLGFIKTLCREEQVDALLPLTDIEIDVLTDSPIRDDERTALWISGRETIGLCRDKLRLEAFLAKQAVCRTIPGRRLSEVRAEAKELCYPVVVKPYNGRSSQGLSIISDAEEFLHLKKRLRAEADRFLVQEKIEGSVITVDVVRNPESGQTICMPRKELLRTLNGCGTTVYLFSDTELERQCVDIAAALDIRGCVNFEFIEDGGGRYHFLECNPRFSGGVAFSCLAGYDMIKNHVRCFTGAALDAKVEQPSCYMARRYTEYQTKIGE